MAITASNLTQGASPTDSQTYDTSSVTPGSNRLMLVSVTIRNPVAANLGTISLSGNGLTWVEIATITYSTIATPLERTSIFRSMGASPSSGAITITITGSGNTAAAWSVDEFNGVDTSGTNGSGAIVQSATDASDSSTADPPAPTLSALADAVNNAVYSAFGNVNGRSLTPGGSYNELADQVSGACAIQTQWLLPGTTTPTVTGFSSGDDSGGIAVEIKAAAGGVTTRPYYAYAQQ